MKLAWHGAYARGALFVLGLAITVLSAIGSAAPAKHVTLNIDGVKKEVASQGGSVGEALKDNGIEVSREDAVTPDVKSDLVDKMTITVKHAVPVRVYVNGGYLKVDSAASTVSEVLAELGIKVNSPSELFPAAGTAVTRDMAIVLDPEIELTELYKKTVPFKTVKKSVLTLAPGKTRVAVKGVNGTNTVFEQRLYHGSAVVSKTMVEKVLVKPVDQVMEVGAGPADGKLGRAIRMEATAYVPGYDGVGWRTATGARAGKGIIAVDPRVIKLGTKLYVPGYGYGVAADTGGAIKGNRIDLCYDTIGPALQWGRRGVTVYVVS